ncbi:hypothetical protein LAZ67_X002233 [Cordylochernes scorpioides]|uniref:Endonuclease/exonuclease/phosphatase domain-containing protein n=1 Tax=Cordylochernes scorpioides TaxID=51811 RepID=A0ABY6LVC5_9ARAC|nr:hypothetical protein LAZ67_X002233 [Cordylochernes scorpioides]
MPRRSRALIGRNTAASRRYRNAIAIETPLQSETRRALRRLRYSEARVAAAQTMQVPVQRIQLCTQAVFRMISVFPLIDYLKQYDIFVLTETWCQNPLNFSVENYKIYHSPALKTLKRGRSSGGIIMGVGKRIQPLIEKVEVESQWISAIFKLVPTADSLLVCMIFVYLPPIQTQLENLKKLFSYIENKIQEGFKIVLYGDLNVRTGDFGDFNNLLDTPTLLSASRASSDPVSSSLSETLVDFFDDKSLTILNGRSTSDRNGNFTFISSQGSSVIDLAVVSPALLELIVDLSVECMPYSDHLPLVLKIKGLDNMKSKYSTKFCFVTKYSRVADKAISFKGNLRDLAILPLTGSTLDSQVERLTIEIQTAMSRAGMRREIRSGGLRSKPWYDEECYTAKKKNERKS